MHNVRLELLQLRVKVRHGHADRQGVNARHIHYGHAGDAEALVGCNFFLSLLRPRCDNQGFVPVGTQML